MEKALPAAVLVDLKVFLNMLGFLFFGFIDKVTRFVLP
jgi:hypothetical protein